MDAEFWLERWREGKIGFHEGAPNAWLVRYAERLAPARRVLVPLCGKTEDLAFLAASGREVVGIELAEDAVRAFFAEHGAAPTVREHGAFRVYEAALGAGRVTLWAGDLFATTADALGPLDGLYDRAALVALPRETRARYAAHLATLLAPGAHGLVVTFDYPQDRMDGPPFAVGEAEVRALFARDGGGSVETLGRGPAENARLREAGGVAEEIAFAVRF